QDIRRKVILTRRAIYQKVNVVNQAFLKTIRYFYDEPRKDLISAGLRKRGLLQCVRDNPYDYFIKPFINFYNNKIVRLIVTNTISALKDITCDLKTVLITWPQFLVKKCLINIIRFYSIQTYHFHDTITPEFIC